MDLQELELVFDNTERKFIVDDELALMDIGTGRTREDITRVEVLAAMNSVNIDLTFTMELCNDFTDDRLPTLSFSIWQDITGLKHSYFEKSMRNQTLVVERSALGRNSLMNIMSKELVHRLEVLHDDLKGDQKIMSKILSLVVNN